MNTSPTRNKVRFITKAALIAASYAAITLALAPFGFGMIQFRVSEALCVLPYFMAEAIPGLFIGCIIANLFSSNIVVIDVVFGSLATLLGAISARVLRKSPYGKFLCPLPNIVFNTVIVSAVITYSMGAFSEGSAISVFSVNALSVGVSEVVSCYGLGLVLLFFIKKRFPSLDK